MGPIYIETPYIYTYTEWAEIIGQSHGSHVYWDTLVGRVFANGPGDLGSIPDCVLPKTLKMVLDTSLLNTQQYKVHIKGKVEHSRESVAPSPTPWCSSYWKGSLLVALNHSRQLYFYIYTYTEWAEIIGQSHGSHVYWDTLYIYIYWVSRNNRAVTWVPSILRHPIKMWEKYH